MSTAKRILPIVLLVAGFGLLGGCAGMSQKDCQTADWAKIGYQDGYDGKVPEEFLKHRDTCGDYGVTADVEAYQKARAQALLDEYCTEDRGMKEGLRGHRYHDVCPSPVDRLFMQGYIKGREFYKAEQGHRQMMIREGGRAPEYDKMKH